jgi:hypothetical protein
MMAASRGNPIPVGRSIQSLGTKGMHRCHICGLAQSEAPWGESGTDPSWNICACCGCEYGYDDFLAIGCDDFRAKWIASGAPWFRPELRPTDWQLAAQ